MQMPRTLFVCLVAILCSAGQGDAGEWFTGRFSFSDELGGFTIKSVSGKGTRHEPIVVTQHLHVTAPATLVIRTRDAPETRGVIKSQPFLQFSLVIVVTNASNKNWAGFDLELQEQRGRPSVYVDGLSFDQMRTYDGRVFRSDRFSRFTDLTEPFDRIRFENGSVTPNDTVRFELYITDVTPRGLFYLVLDPQILIAEGPTRKRFAHYGR